MKLDHMYYDTGNAAYLGSAAKLFNAAKSFGFTKPDVVDWLKSQDSYTLHRSARRKYKKNLYILLTTEDLWQADLADLSSLSRHNDGVRFLLGVIDTFSEFMWIEPLKNKTAEAVLAAF